MLENGTYATIAAAEKINVSYVGRVFRLTLLAPDIVEAILDGRHPVGLQLDWLMRRFPVEWETQAKAQYEHELPYKRQNENPPARFPERG